MIVDVEKAKVDGAYLLVGPFSRGVLVRMPMEAVLRALTKGGFDLVPREFVEMLDKAIKDAQDGD